MRCRQEDARALIGIVIVAHGGLAREYLAAVEHVVGPQNGVRAISVESNDDRVAKADEITQAARDVDRGAGVAIVTDMFGGSPANLSLPACRSGDRRMLYGANLPMLIKLAKSRDKPLPEAVRDALYAARKYTDSQNISVED